MTGVQTCALPISVVTLEPCNHTGRTGPCAEALLAAGVRRVVHAMDDPNPVASGGAGTLRAAGVLTQFIAQAGKGSLENFGASALVESAVRGAVDSGAGNTLIDRLVDQASNAATAPGAANAPSNLSPEMRALIKVALASAVMLAKNEVTRSLKEDLAPAPRVEAKPAPAAPSVMTKDEGRN